MPAEPDSIGLAPNLEVSLICQPDDTRFRAPGFATWVYEAWLAAMRRLARPVFQAHDPRLRSVRPRPAMLIGTGPTPRHSSKAISISIRRSRTRGRGLEPASSPSRWSSARRDRRRSPSRAPGRCRLKLFRPRRRLARSSQAEQPGLEPDRFSWRVEFRPSRRATTCKVRSFGFDPELARPDGAARSFDAGEPLRSAPRPPARGALR
jgi:hypothetical protein